jgi:hypothetical protein
MWRKMNKISFPPGVKNHTLTPSPYILPQQHLYPIYRRIQDIRIRQEDYPEMRSIPVIKSCAGDQ